MLRKKIFNKKSDSSEYREYPEKHQSQILQSQENSLLQYQKHMNQKKIAIIGAGPTGIFSTLLLKNFSGEVHLFEKNRDIGEKLKLTGGGRMNVMNKEFSEQQFFSQSNDRKKKHFFKNPFANTQKISELFDEIETEYIWEKKRAILKSQDAKSEVHRLKQKIMAQPNTTLHLGTEISKITRTKTPKKNIQKFLITSKSETDNIDREFDYVVVSTGGMFQVKEDCNRDKTYRFAEFFGHKISKISPSLSPFRVEEHHLKNASGGALQSEIFSGQGKKKKSILDDLLITHFGFSGPAVLDFSAIWDGKEKIFINFLPTLTPELFLSIFTTARKGKHSLHRFLHRYFSKKFIESLLSFPEFSEKFKHSLEGNEAIHIADISKKDEKILSRLIFSYPLVNPQKFPYQGCWTTKGGINLNEIEISTLESKFQKNLFFGGEILDIDGLCGGYHLSFTMICAQTISTHIQKNS